MAHTQPKRQTIKKQKVQNFVYKFFTAIRLNNETERDFLIEQGTDPKKLFVVPLVVSQNIFKLTNTKHDTRKDLVYFGNVAEKKNLITILKALKIIIETNNELKLNVIGNIWDKSFKIKIKELGLENNIIIHGYLPQDEKLNRLLNNVLISVNSSLDEGQCVAVYDTALSGNVLCLPNIMSFTEVFNNKALFHDVHDHKKLAENILYYINNPAIIEQYQRKCIEMIRVDYSINTVENKLKYLISKI
jgi:glycosyltransferase involved in cell wall biosynthesis